MILAFQPASPEEAPIWVFVIVIIVVSLVFVGLVLRLIFRQVSKCRELSHLERMKALELGLPTGPSEAEKCQEKYLRHVFWIAFWMGGAVPIVATSAAANVITRAEFQYFNIILAIWICTAVICVASVICTTVLMVSSRCSRGHGLKASDDGKMQLQQEG